VAHDVLAAARRWKLKRSGLHGGGRRRAATLGAALALALPAWTGLSAGNNVRITGLSDAAFGTLASLSADSVRSQDICVYSNSPTNGYYVQATGSGAGGAFTLASGSNALAYEVQWSPVSGQSTGTALSPNVALTGQVSAATQPSCNSGPSSSASLIIILRSNQLSTVSAGSYSGSLTLLVAPE
jgi:hypothetical protein